MSHFRAGVVGMAMSPAAPGIGGQEDEDRKQPNPREREIFGLPPPPPPKRFLTGGVQNLGV